MSAPVNPASVADRDTLDEALFSDEKAFDPDDLRVYLPPVPPAPRAVFPVVSSLPPMGYTTPIEEVAFPLPPQSQEVPAACGSVWDGNGSYEMANLSPGVYEVREVQPLPSTRIEQIHHAEPVAEVEEPVVPSEEVEATSEVAASPALVAPEPIAPPSEEMEATTVVVASPEVTTPEQIASPPRDLRVEINATLTLGTGETAPIGPDLLRITGADSPCLLNLLLLSPPMHGAVLRDGFTITGGDIFTQEDIDAGRIAYRHDDESTATEDNFTFATPAGEILSERFEVHIRPRRQAPRLTDAGSLQGVQEGIAVSQLLDGFAEADGPCGLAVVGAVGAGAWECSTDEGRSWQALDEVAPSRALLLAPSGRLRFTPRPGPLTMARLTYRAWDQSLGQAGERIDPSVADGEETAFSREATASLRFAGAPAPRPAAPEPWGEVFCAGEQAGGAVAIVRLSGEGTWQFSLSESDDWRDCGSIYHGRALLLGTEGRLRFLPRRGAAGKVSLSLRDWDGLDGKPGSRADLAGRGRVGGTTAFGEAARSWSWMLGAPG